MTDALYQTPVAARALDAATGTNTGPAGRGDVAAPVAAWVAGPVHQEETPAPNPAGVGAEAGPVGGEEAVPTVTPAGLVLSIRVVGTPKPQGSKRGFVVNGRAVVVDTNKQPLRTWRQDVKEAARGQIELLELAGEWQQLTDVTIDVTFLMPRPKSHYRTGKNAHLLREDAPTRHTTKPDGDKLLRSTLDALGECGLYRDDSNVGECHWRKRYTDGHPGAVIHVYRGGA